MNIYLLKPQDGLPENDNPWSPWYDKAFGFVVRAGCEDEARRLASKESGSEDYHHAGNPWLVEQYSSCEVLAEGVMGGAEVVLRDYAAA